MKALHIHVGERARRHIALRGLSPSDVRVIPAAAGGPKGLMLTHLDQHLFGRWLPKGGHTVHLVGASIGAWRMATAAMPDPVQALRDLAHGYIHQHIEPRRRASQPASRKRCRSFSEVRFRTS